MRQHVSGSWTQGPEGGLWHHLVLNDARATAWGPFGKFACGQLVEIGTLHVPVGSGRLGAPLVTPAPETQCPACAAAASHA